MKILSKSGEERQPQVGGRTGALRRFLSEARIEDSLPPRPPAHNPTAFKSQDEFITK